MPKADTQAMNAHLAEISRTVAKGAHAIIVLDGAGWRGSKALQLPDNISLLPLPPYAPELNPIENVWACLRATASPSQSSKPTTRPSQDAAMLGTTSPTTPPPSSPSQRDSIPKRSMPKAVRITCVKWRTMLSGPQGEATAGPHASGTSPFPVSNRPETVVPASLPPLFGLKPADDHGHFRLFSDLFHADLAHDPADRLVQLVVIAPHPVFDARQEVVQLGLDGV